MGVYRRGVTTGLTPFFANYGRHPLIEMTMLSPTEAENPESLAYAHWLSNTFTAHRKALEASQYWMSKYADKHWAAPPTYWVRDLVILLSRTIKI